MKKPYFQKKHKIVKLSKKTNSFQTLSFKDPCFKALFDNENKEITLFFLRLFLCFALFHTLCLDIKTILQKTYKDFLRINLSALVYIFLLFFHKRILMKMSKLVLDVLFCLMIALIYIMHIQMVIIPYSKSASYDSYTMFFMGVSIEIFRVFLYMARVNCLLFSGTNVIMNTVVFYNLSQSPSFNGDFIQIQFPVIVGNFCIPVLLILFKEKNERFQFMKQKKFEKFYRSYENLIEKLIPDPILILSSSQMETLFCNEATHRTFKTHRNEEIFSQLAQIEVSLEENKTTNLFEIYQKQLNLCDFEPCNETYEGVFVQDQSISSEISIPCGQRGASDPGLNKIKKTYFNIKFLNIYWRERKAFLILLTDTSSVFNYKKMKEIALYKDNILATFSHDLRSPLSGIVGMLEIACDSIDSTHNLYDLLHNALNSSKILKSIVNDIIDFSFFTRKKQLAITCSKEKLLEPIEEVLSIVETQIQQKSLKLIRDFGDNSVLRAIALVDVSRFKQILLNLLLNAVKFTNSGSICVRVSIRSAEHIAEIAIEDTGIGIAEENIRKIFSFLEKNDNRELNYSRAGLGFGLVISQILAEALSPNGKGIQVKSELWKGSQFSFEIPLEEFKSENSLGQIPSEREHFTVFSEGTHFKKLDPLEKALLSWPAMPTPDKKGLHTEDNSCTKMKLINNDSVITSPDNLPVKLGFGSFSDSKCSSLIIPFKKPPTLTRVFNDSMQNSQLKDSMNPLLENKPIKNKELPSEETPRGKSKLPSQVIDSFPIPPVKQMPSFKLFQRPDMQQLNARQASMQKSLEKSPNNNNLAPTKKSGDRVLLVDDDMINIMVHAEFLKKFNLEYDMAFNGRQAVDKVVESMKRETHYTIVLMDLNMPVLDGFRASEEIKALERNGDLPELNIVAVTANASIKDKEKCLESGMCHVLEKPVSIDVLRDFLEKKLGKTLKTC